MITDEEHNFILKTLLDIVRQRPVYAERCEAIQRIQWVYNASDVREALAPLITILRRSQQQPEILSINNGESP